MSISARKVAGGQGWSVSDIICRAGPRDRPFEEQHKTVTLALVTEGSFQYRTRRGAAVLAPGAVLLGEQGACFACGHEHAVGDRCLAFHFSAERMEGVVAAVPGARRLGFTAAALPPMARTLPLLAGAEAARDTAGGATLEEIGLDLAGVVVAALNDVPTVPRQPTRHDQRRATQALRRIEAEPDTHFALADLAAEAGMSPFHFLRVFRAVVGMTPHQYTLRTRLHRAAVRLRRTGDTISRIAFAAGFNDLSSFNHRFRRQFGTTPGGWRRGG